MHSVRKITKKSHFNIFQKFEFSHTKNLEKINKLGRDILPRLCEGDRTLWLSELVLDLPKRHFYLTFLDSSCRIYYSATFTLFF